MSGGNAAAGGNGYVSGLLEPSTLAKSTCANARFSWADSRWFGSSSPFRKKISLCPSGKSSLQARPSRLRKEGRFAIVTSVGRGMRWTRQRARRAHLPRTTKSCGSGAPWLALSWRRCFASRQWRWL